MISLWANDCNFFNVAPKGKDVAVLEQYYSFLLDLVQYFASSRSAEGLVVVGIWVRV